MLECVRMRSPTHIVSFNVWYRELLRNVLSYGALATSCGARDDPHVAVVGGSQGGMNLLDRAFGCIVHW